MLREIVYPIVRIGLLGLVLVTGSIGVLTNLYHWYKGDMEKVHGYYKVWGPLLGFIGNEIQEEIKTMEHTPRSFKIDSSKVSSDSTAVNPY